MLPRLSIFPEPTVLPGVSSGRGTNSAPLFTPRYGENVAK